MKLKKLHSEIWNIENLENLLNLKKIRKNLVLKNLSIKKFGKSKKKLKILNSYKIYFLKFKI